MGYVPWIVVSALILAAVLAGLLIAWRLRRAAHTLNRILDEELDQPAGEEPPHRRPAP